LYCTFLDASKAFDRVAYCQMFRLLIKRRLPPVVIRFYRAMHFSAKRGIAIACRLSVCPSVCL